MQRSQAYHSRFSKSLPPPLRRPTKQQPPMPQEISVQAWCDNMEKTVARTLSLAFWGPPHTRKSGPKCSLQCDTIVYSKYSYMFGCAYSLLYAQTAKKLPMLLSNYKRVGTNCCEPSRTSVWQRAINKLGGKLELLVKVAFDKHWCPTLLRTRDLIQTLTECYLTAVWWSCNSIDPLVLLHGRHLDTVGL